MQPAAFIVDDDPSVCAVFSRLLGKMGYAVEVSNDGQLALGLVTSRAYDVCLVDQQLPGVGGVAVARAIRQHTPDAVIVFITGQPTTASAEELVGVADEYLTKPFDLETLRETVTSLVAGRDRRRLGQPSPVPARPQGKKWAHLWCTDELVSDLVSRVGAELGLQLTTGAELPGDTPDVLVLSADLASFEVRKVIWGYQAKRRSFQVVLVTDPSLAADSAAAVALRASWRITVPAKPEQTFLVLSSALR